MAAEQMATGTILISEGESMQQVRAGLYARGIFF